MGILLRFTHVIGWPSLAWVAQCSDTEVVLAHGSRVETAQDWFAEAVWPGPFGEGHFDQTDLVFGSGGRLSNGTVTFVSSGSTLDRLVSFRVGKHVYISNSLVALCATLNLSVDPLSDNYYSSFFSIVGGLQKYKHLLQTTRGPLRLTYFHNLRWDGHSLDVIEKPFGNRTFDTFEEYRGFLEASLSTIGRNMRDPQRKYQYLPLGTLSAGYDSPTIAVLARAMGNTEVLTFPDGRRGRSDSGETIATRLGLRAIVLDRTAWRQQPFSEVPFLAADAYGQEMHFVAARSSLQGRVLLTGHHGDTAWGIGDYDRTPDMGRNGGPSGHSLTEWRLWVGFIHCPVSFFGLRNIGRSIEFQSVTRCNLGASAATMIVRSVAGSLRRPVLSGNSSANRRMRPQSTSGPSQRDSFPTSPCKTVRGGSDTMRRDGCGGVRFRRIGAPTLTAYCLASQVGGVLSETPVFLQPFPLGPGACQTAVHEHGGHLLTELTSGGVYGNIRSTRLLTAAFL
ncbi:hypothetical protein [Nitrospira sp. BLG_2]|uniref:hypothetical protein n=1 Tax=Nitrospira sp. BLG_2 TaxID=3397507 RepID=UPI003B98EC0A